MLGNVKEDYVRDTSGQAGTLTIMAPVRRADVGLLLGALDALQPAAPAFAACERLHYARFVLLQSVADQAPRIPATRLDRPRLLFTASFDGPERSFVEELRQAVAAAGEDGGLSWANVAWGCCEGYPGAGSAGAFALYFACHRVPTTEFIAAYGDATVQEVRNALRLQASLRQFALEVQAAQAAELRTAFMEAFPC